MLEKGEFWVLIWSKKLTEKIRSLVGGCTRVLEHRKRKSIHHTTSALTYGIVSHVSKLGEGTSSLPVSLYPSYLEMDLLQRRDRGLVISNLWSLAVSSTGKCRKRSGLSNRFMLCFEKVWAWCAMLRLCADKLWHLTITCLCELWHLTVTCLCALWQAMSSVFFNKGENCIAAGRLFVEESIHDEFLERIVSFAVPLLLVHLSHGGGGGGGGGHLLASFDTELSPERNEWGLRMISVLRWAAVRVVLMFY